MAINTGVNISKAVGYAVLEIVPGVDITKAVGFAVLESIYPPAWSVGTFPNGMESLAYSASVPLTAGSLPVSFTVLSGSLPTGLSLSASGLNATISGTPTVAGTYPFTLRATNTYGTADQSFSITIAAAPVVGGGGSYTFAS